MATLPPPPPPMDIPAMSHTSPSKLTQSSTGGTTAMRTNTNSSSTSILSEKVARALEVRTDTPAMKSALDALSKLSLSTTNTNANKSSSKNTSSTSNMIDARSVRVAIERDALHQARLLSSELNSLVTTVREMRGQIQNVSSVAEEVKSKIDQSVVIHSSNKPTEDGGSLLHGRTELEEEEHLANVLSSAFREREEAKGRYDAICIFMDKFDVDEEDSYLLEHYNFENVFEDNDNEENISRRASLISNASVEDNEEGKKSHKDGMAFLDALERVSKIRTELSTSFDTTTTSSKSSSSSKLGATSAMRLMESLASKQERAYERLYHFLHDRLDLNQKSVVNVPTSSSSTPHYQPTPNNMENENEVGMDETLSHPFIKRSLLLLRQIPAYYTHTLELVASSRRSEVTRSFLLALTSGWGGMAPLEVRAHDPVGYVGDMLAFVFRCFSVESVLAKGLAPVDDISDDNDSEEEGGIPNVSSGIEQPMTAVDVLNDTMSGIARPLKSRISQVVTTLSRRSGEEDDVTMDSHGRIVGGRTSGGGGMANGMVDDDAGVARVRSTSLYSICGLILFYSSAFKKAMDKLRPNNTITDESKEEDAKNSPVLQCLVECLEEATQAYVASIKIYSSQLKTYSTLSHPSESPSQISLAILKSLCEERDASPGFGPDVEEVVDCRFLNLEFLVDTVMEGLSGYYDGLDDVVNAKDALFLSKKGGLNSETHQKWNDVVKEKEQNIVDKIIEDDTRTVLTECGLSSLYDAMESMRSVYIEGMSISSHPGLSQEDVKRSMEVFYKSLNDPPFPSYEDLVQDPVLRKGARKKLAENVGKVYGEIYGTVRGGEGDYEELGFLKYTPEEVESLLSQ